MPVCRCCKHLFICSHNNKQKEQSPYRVVYINKRENGETPGFVSLIKHHSVSS